jgi:DNA repair exonuclease SbcCD ATPase subunit
MEENKDLNNLIVVEQLPIIKEQLQIISDEVDKEIDYALSLECTEDSKIEVKKARARLNKINQTLEDKRKAVKKAIEEPYRAFEEVYDKLIKDKLKLADGQLKAKIDDIENEQKNQKIEEVQEFFDNQVEARGLKGWFQGKQDFGVTLSASMKSIKDNIIAELDRLEEALKLIELEEYSDEILVEFKKNGDFAKSKMEVLERHKQLEALKEQKEEQQELEQQEEKIEQQVEAVIEPPKEIIEDEDVITVQFTIKDTKANILKVREFMKEEGIKYE